MRNTKKQVLSCGICLFTIFFPLPFLSELLSTFLLQAEKSIKAISFISSFFKRFLYLLHWTWIFSPLLLPSGLPFYWDWLWDWLRVLLLVLGVNTKRIAFPLKAILSKSILLIYPNYYYHHLYYFLLLFSYHYPYHYPSLFFFYCYYYFFHIVNTVVIILLSSKTEE